MGWFSRKKKKKAALDDADLLNGDSNETSAGTPTNAHAKAAAKVPGLQLNENSSVASTNQKPADVPETGAQPLTSSHGGEGPRSSRGGTTPRRSGSPTDGALMRKGSGRSKRRTRASAPSTPRSSSGRSHHAHPSRSLNTSGRVPLAPLEESHLHPPSQPSELPLLQQSERSVQDLAADQAVAERAAAAAAAATPASGRPTGRPQGRPGGGVAASKRRATLTAAELATLELPASCERCHKRAPAARVTINGQQQFMCRQCVEAAERLETDNSRMSLRSSAVTPRVVSSPGAPVGALRSKALAHVTGGSTIGGKTPRRFSLSGSSGGGGGGGSGGSGGGGGGSDVGTGTLRRGNVLSNALTQLAKRAGIGAEAEVGDACCLVLEPRPGVDVKPYLIVFPNGPQEMHEWASVLKACLAGAAVLRSSGGVAKEPGIEGPASLTAGWLVKKGKRRYFVLDQAAFRLLWFSKEVPLEPAILQKKAKNSLSLADYAGVTTYAAEPDQSQYVAPEPMTEAVLAQVPPLELFASAEFPLPVVPVDLPVHVVDNVNDWGVALGGTAVPVVGKGAGKQKRKTLTANYAEDDDLFDDDGEDETTSAPPSLATTTSTSGSGVLLANPLVATTSSGSLLELKGDGHRVKSPSAAADAGDEDGRASESQPSEKLAAAGGEGASDNGDTEDRAAVPRTGDASADEESGAAAKADGNNGDAPASEVAPEAVASNSESNGAAAAIEAQPKAPAGAADKLRGRELVRGLSSGDLQAVKDFRTEEAIDEMADLLNDLAPKK